MKSKILNASISHTLDKSDIIDLLSDDTYNELLYQTADKIREKHLGNQVYLRALVEISNICQNNCLYCGIRAQNTKTTRYKLSKDEILKTVKKAVELGFKTVVLQSGEASVYSTDEMTNLIDEIKKYDIALTLSLGEKSFEEYKAYKKAGADRYLLRIETTDKKLYEKMHPDMNFENRIRCLKDLKNLGYEVGTGCLVGLPNQTISSLADDILFFKEINADMIGLGPFIATKNTPLSNAQNGSFELARKMVAIVRILMPDINIPATTAMETIQKNGRILALQSGANVVMPNITPIKNRENYSIYTNKSSIDADNLDLLKQELQSINREISLSKGFRKK